MRVTRFHYQRIQLTLLSPPLPLPDTREELISNWVVVTDTQLVLSQDVMRPAGPMWWSGDNQFLFLETLFGVLFRPGGQNTGDSESACAEQSRAVTERMLARRLLVLLLQLPLVLLLPQETEEVVDTPVAAALVSGENSDLGKCFHCSCPHLSPLTSLSYQENTPGMWDSSERSPRLGS